MIIDVRATAGVLLRIIVVALHHLIGIDRLLPTAGVDRLRLTIVIATENAPHIVVSHVTQLLFVQNKLVCKI